MNEKRSDIFALILAFIALVISIYPCVLPFLMRTEIFPAKFLKLLWTIVGFLLKTGGTLGLAIAVVSLILVRRSQSRLMHKTVWAISSFAILMSIFWVISSIIMLIENFREPS